MVMGCHLSDKELESLGVTRSRNVDKRTRLVYTVNCDICGKPFEIRRYNTSNAYKCSSCKEQRIEVDKRLQRMLKEKIEHEEAEEIGVDHKHYERFESAASNFGIKYYCAIEQASKVMNKFDSVPEAMACIELLYIGVRVIPQQKVGKYTVDFCLPDYKTVIEIDGSLYHQDPNKDYWRDVALKKSLGEDWVIKHIPAQSLKDNHSLFGKGMKKMLDDRKYELKIR